MALGKVQPLENQPKKDDEDGNYHFVSGTRYWAFDR